MASKPPGSFRPGDFSLFFERFISLGDHPPHYFVVGGQAVNIWADVFVAEGCTTLLDLQPFTSRDCDVWVDKLGFELTDLLPLDEPLSDFPKLREFTASLLPTEDLNP